MMAASAFKGITRLQLIPSCLLTRIHCQSLMTSLLLWQEEKKFSKVDLSNAYHRSYWMNDIIVTGKNDEDHLKNLSVVLSQLQKYGLRLKRANVYSYNRRWSS